MDNISQNDSKKKDIRIIEIVNYIADYFVIANGYRQTEEVEFKKAVGIEPNRTEGAT